MCFNKLVKGIPYWLIGRAVYYRGRELCYMLWPVDRCPKAWPSLEGSALFMVLNWREQRIATTTFRRAVVFFFNNTVMSVCT